MADPARSVSRDEVEAIVRGAYVLKVPGHSNRVNLWSALGPGAIRVTVKWTGKGDAVIVTVWRNPRS